VATAAASTSLLADAEEAATLAQADPAAALRMANEVLDRIDDTDLEVRAVARWAQGLAHRELEALDEAHRSFAAAAADADHGGLAHRAARIRLSWSLVLVYRGDTDAALAAMEAARPHLEGLEAGHCDVQHALVMMRLGRLDEALDDTLRALPILRANGDRLAEARLLNNLTVLRVYRAELDLALDASRAARAIGEELGQQLLVARTLHNEAYVHGRRGDVPRSLAGFDDADAAYRQLEDPEPYLAVLDADRAEVLLGAGLAAEACERAEASLAALDAAGNVTDRAEVALLVARCRLAASDREGAATAAADAADRFDEQQRRSWSAMARHVGIEAIPVHDPALAAQAEGVADELAVAGWRSAALQARVLAARARLSAGDAAGARRLLAAAANRRVPRTAADRAATWYANALLRVVEGDRRGARRAASAGLRVVDDHRATLGASEMRAHAAAAGVDLARIGLRLAIDDGRPREALQWMESARAVSVLVPPARPPDDEALADDLAQLRIAESERATASSPERADELVARVRALEAAVARRTRRVAGEQRPGAFRAADLLDALAGTALLEYAMLDGELFGLVASGGRVRMRSLGPVDPLEREVSSVGFSLQRLARRGASEASQVAARAALDHSLDLLARALVAPFRRELGDRPVVVVPSASIRRLPWGALDGLAGRPTSVAPSAMVWQRARAVDPPALDRCPVLVAAGPDLPGAALEVREVGRLHEGATVLSSRRATAAAVLGRLAEGVGLAHIAAHGTFRADNPLFSCLVLADGPVTVHELAALGNCPPWVVLSACDAAIHGSPAGDEILGLGAGLLSIGAAALVAPVAPVPDTATRPLMRALHRRLVGGDPPAVAVAALATPPAAAPADRAAQVAFGVLGA
jgi:tetratricopeptide (TPR) repeat protein